MAEQVQASLTQGQPSGKSPSDSSTTAMRFFTTVSIVAGLGAITVIPFAVFTANGCSPSGILKNPRGPAVCLAVVAAVTAVASSLLFLQVRRQTTKGHRAAVAVAVVLAVLAPFIVSSQISGSLALKASKLVALDVKAGKPIWSTPVETPAITGIDVTAAAVSVEAYHVSGSTRLSFDPRTGDQLPEPAPFDIHATTRAPTEPGTYRYDWPSRAVIWMSASGEPQWSYVVAGDPPPPPATPPIVLAGDVMYLATKGRIPFSEQSCS